MGNGFSWAGNGSLGSPGYHWLTRNDMVKAANEVIYRFNLNLPYTILDLGRKKRSTAAAMDSCMSYCLVSDLKIKVLIIASWHLKL